MSRVNCTSRRSTRRRLVSKSAFSSPILIFATNSSIVLISSSVRLISSSQLRLKRSQLAFQGCDDAFQPGLSFHQHLLLKASYQIEVNEPIHLVTVFGLVGLLSAPVFPARVGLPPLGWFAVPQGPPSSSWDSTRTPVTHSIEFHCHIYYCMIV